MTPALVRTCIGLYSCIKNIYIFIPVQCFDELPCDQEFDSRKIDHVLGFILDISEMTQAEN